MLLWCHLETHTCRSMCILTVRTPPSNHHNSYMITQLVWFLADERRAYISGFTGSAGTALITQDAALLWTDGRYFLQAEEELGAEWSLMRALQPGVPSLEAWLAAELPVGATVGIDPMVHSVDDAKKLTDALAPSRNLCSLEVRSPAHRGCSLLFTSS